MKKYYCNKCEKYHYRGKIFREHLYYKREIPKNQTYEEDNIKINLNDLRPIAKRQLLRLLKKAKTTKNHDLYRKEIIKLIENEKRR